MMQQNISEQQQPMHPMNMYPMYPNLDPNYMMNMNNFDRGEYPNNPMYNQFNSYQLYNQQPVRNQMNYNANQKNTK